MTGRPRPLTADIVEYLRYEIDEGRSRIEVSSEIAAKIASGSRPSIASPAAAPSPVSTSASGAVPKNVFCRSPTLSEGSGRESLKIQVDPALAGLDLHGIAEKIAVCTRCSLNKTRTRTVPGQGNTVPEIMFIGEGPGEDEDIQGLAFVGAAGQLLTRMITAMGLTRDEVFIGNIVKCRPPGNRTPLPDEVEACLPYLRAQISLLKPKVIVALGATAVKALTNTGIGITRLRGKWMEYQGMDLMPTFHPSYLLRVPSARHDVWEDMKAVLGRLGKPIPEIKRQSKQG